MSSFVKFYRQLLDNDFLIRDNNAYLVFTKLLLRVNWKTGSITTGRYKFGLLVNLKPTTAYATLRRLENAQMVTLVSDRSSTKITVVNWKKFQSSDTSDDNSMTTSRQQNDTINKNKRRKEEKNNTKVLGIYGNPDINRILETFENSFGMKPVRIQANRNAAQRILLKVKDIDKVCRIVEYAASIQGDKYSPSVGSLLDIEEKLIKLVAHSKSATGRMYDAG